MMQASILLPSTRKETPYQHAGRKDISKPPGETAFFSISKLLPTSPR